MFVIKHLIRILTLSLLLVIISNPSFSDNHSNDLKKINEQLNSVKKLFDTGVLDEEGYRSAKNRLDEKKKIGTDYEHFLRPVFSCFHEKRK